MVWAHAPADRPAEAGGTSSARAHPINRRHDRAIYLTARRQQPGLGRRHERVAPVDPAVQRDQLDASASPFTVAASARTRATSFVMPAARVNRDDSAVNVA